MEAVVSIQPSLRIEPASYPPTGQQRSPFVLGQWLQATVSARIGPQQFTLEVGGLQVRAESAAQLQAGQQLDLQVISLAPEIELQIVPKDPVSRMIGNSLYLAGQQAATLPELALLAEQSRQLPQVSPSSQEILQLFAAGTAVRPALEPALSLPQQATRLVELIGNALPALAGGDHAESYQAIGKVLQQWSGSPFLTQPLASETATLAALFLESARVPSGAAAFATPTQAEDTATVLARLEGLLGKETASSLALLNQLGPLLERLQLPQDHPITQLLDLLSRMDLASQPLPERQLNGPGLETLINRLGMHMEQRLAAEDPQEAVRTLKYALLELSQHLESREKGPARPETLVKTIELFQLLQIRLANESLLFLPLPLSFLGQGFLLVDTDRPGGGKEGQSGPAEGNRSYELHLQLEGLGNLRIGLQQHENRVSLQFFAEDAERARYLADFRPLLNQSLSAVKVETVQFLIGSKEPAAALLEKIMHGTTGMIDTRI